jgi:hypothetical protein
VQPLPIRAHLEQPIRNLEGHPDLETATLSEKVVEATVHHPHRVFQFAVAAGKVERPERIKPAVRGRSVHNLERHIPRELREQDATPGEPGQHRSQDAAL